jgi:hypothetical protein
MTNHVAEPSFGAFIRELAETWDGNGGHGAGVNEALYAVPARNFEQVPCSGNVALVNFAGISGRKAVISGHVKDAPGATYRCMEGGCIPEVTVDVFHG